MPLKVTFDVEFTTVPFKYVILHGRCRVASRIFLSSVVFAYFFSLTPNDSVDSSGILRHWQDKKTSPATGLGPSVIVVGVFLAPVRISGRIKGYAQIALDRKIEQCGKVLFDRVRGGRARLLARKRLDVPRSEFRKGQIARNAAQPVQFAADVAFVAFRKVPILQTGEILFNQSRHSAVRRCPAVQGLRSVDCCAIRRTERDRPIRPRQIASETLTLKFKTGLAMPINDPGYAGIRCRVPHDCAVI